MNQRRIPPKEFHSTTMTRKTAAEVRAFKERMSDMFKNVTIGEFLELIALIKGSLRLALHTTSKLTAFLEHEEQGGRLYFLIPNS